MPGQIMIVDDDPTMRAMLAQCLEMRGHDVTECAGLDDALAEIERAPPDVVLTDLRLIGASGFELCVRARSLRPGLPVVIMSGFGHESDGTAATRAGAYAFVSKPFELAELLLLLERAMDAG
ncbi:MAG: response regulator [Myxococcales bacterium]|nr:response regulator [Myxococcales bacterium]